MKYIKRNRYEGTKGKKSSTTHPCGIGIARTVFGEAIQYQKLWIHHGSYLPFGLQNKDTAMTLNGELYFRHWYREDFSLADYPARHIYIHEMSHVWQRKRGMNFIIRGVSKFCCQLSLQAGWPPFKPLSNGTTGSHHSRLFYTE